MLNIQTVVVSPLQQNTRLFKDPHTHEVTIIDPGADIPQILKQLTPEEKITQIILTHSHIDHVGGLAELLETLQKNHHSKPTVYGHAVEKSFREYIEELGNHYGFPKGYVRNAPEPDVYVSQGDTIRIGGIPFEVRLTPGHSPGHIVLTAPHGEFLIDTHMHTGPLLIAGDVLFRGSIGRTDLPFSSHAELMKSLQTQILPLPDATRVLSGHGPDTTLEREKHFNPFIAPLIA